MKTEIDRYTKKQRGLKEFREELEKYIEHTLPKNPLIFIVDQEKLPGLLELKYHAVSDAAEKLGGVSKIRELFIEFQRHLYESLTA